jgi:hypothetical protein
MKSILPSRRARPEPHPLEATTVWNEYQKAKEYRRSKGANARRQIIGIALAALAVVAIVVAVLLLRPTYPKEQTIPLDAKARSEFVDAQGGKFSDEERRLLTRFLVRVQAQEAAGGAVPKITVADAIERQRSYDREVGEAQKRLQERLDAARSALGVSVREQSVVKSEPGKSASGKSLRYVLEIANRGKRAVDAMSLRIEFRDPSQKYVAAIPTLELKGPLAVGETGRSVQMLPLDPKYNQYILDGGVFQISAYPTQVSYADGEKIDAEKELKLLESLARAKIE